jgi:hypothetical protein
MYTALCNGPDIFAALRKNLGFFFPNITYHLNPTNGRRGYIRGRTDGQTDGELTEAVMLLATVRTRLNPINIFIARYSLLVLQEYNGDLLRCKMINKCSRE